jgi:hypothetical protein
MSFVMPKLRHPQLTKGKAVSYLLDLYRNEPEFVRELDEIRRPYFPLLSGLADTTLCFWAECKKVLPPEDYWAVVEYYQGKRQQAPPLPHELEEQRRLMEQLWTQLQPYANALSELVFKWKLRAPWSVQILIYYDVFDFMILMGLPKEIDVPIDSLGHLYPWPTPLANLMVTVSPWAFFLSGKEQIQREIAQKLSQYESKIKMAGFHEFPSALIKHAKWWFEHHIHGKTYDAIAMMELDTTGNSPTVYGRNVGEAVRRFSNFIGIKPKALK